MIRAVLDSNVVISALLFGGRAQALVPAWRERRFVFLASQALVAEYIRVLHYPKFHLVPEEIRSLVERELLPFLLPVRVRRVPRVIREDPPDDQVLACAAAGHADLLVSGDHHLQRLRTYRSIPIVTIAEFLARLDRPA